MSALIARRWILACAIAFTIAGAGSASARAPKTLQITISAMAFSAPPAAIKVGDTVEWVNNDIVDHTATDKSGLWDVSIAPGKRAKVVMKKAGTFSYYCRYHPNMVAKVVIDKPKGLSPHKP